MFNFLIKRIGVVIPTFIGVTLLTFALIRLIPGDPVELMAGERGVDPARHAQLLHEMGLDKPLLVQYWDYLVGIFQGDLGTSIVTREPVLREFLPCSQPLWNWGSVPLFLRLPSVCPLALSPLSDAVKCRIIRSWACR